jgi:hypothetical protein
MMARQSKHAVHRAHRPADTRAHRAADDGTDRAGVAAAFTRAFLRAADDTLRMSNMRDRQQTEHDGRGRDVRL